jgi:hypothetical protein
MFELKGDHIFLLFFCAAFLFIASALMYTVFKNWFYAMRTKYQIDGIHEDAKKTAAELREIRSQWSSSKWERERLEKEIKEAGEYQSVLNSLNSHQRSIFALQDKFRELNAGKKQKD